MGIGSRKINSLESPIRDINKELILNCRDIESEVSSISHYDQNPNVIHEPFMMLKGRVIDPYEWLIIALPLNQNLSKQYASKTPSKINLNQSLDGYLN